MYINMGDDCIYYPEKNRVYIDCFFYGFWIDKEELKKFTNFDLKSCKVVENF